MKTIVIVMLLGLLAACSSGSSPTARRAPAKSDSATMVAAVRAAGQSVAEVEVQPLRDPQVQDLRDQAEALEAQGKHGLAEERIDQALAISVDDPDLLQWKAELSLFGRKWQVAEQLALRSFEKGPQLGGLCRRNWATMQQARMGRGDAVAAEAARLKIDGCTVAPPVRM